VGASNPKQSNPPFGGFFFYAPNFAHVSEVNLAYGCLLINRKRDYYVIPEVGASNPKQSLLLTAKVFLCAQFCSSKLGKILRIKKPDCVGLCFGFGGERGIRTPGTLPYTTFPR
jgi:hypothetical protein